VVYEYPSVNSLPYGLEFEMLKEPLASKLMVAVKTTTLQNIVSGTSNSSCRIPSGGIASKSWTSGEAESAYFSPSSVRIQDSFLISYNGSWLLKKPIFYVLIKYSLERSNYLTNSTILNGNLKMF
jgi:hypothetical protein